MSDTNNFNSMGRIGADANSITETDIQNMKNGNYMLTNHGMTYTKMSRTMNFSLWQPNVFYNGSKQVGLGGHNIDENSHLTIGAKQTSDPSKLSLQERMFLTVPYLGRGQGNSQMESQLIQGESFINKKSVNHASEVSYMGYSNYPLLSSIQDSVANPENRLESSADESWIRGGMPSRDLVRDNNEYNN